MQRTLTALSFAVIGDRTQVVEYVLKQNQLQKGIYEVKICLSDTLELYVSVCSPFHAF